MITQRYQITDILKESQQKSLYRVQSFTKQGKKLTFVIKKFSLQEKKYFDNELNIYNVVLKDSFLKGFPELKDIVQGKDQLGIVLCQLGDSVEAMRKKVGGRLTLKTVLMLGLQILDRIEFLHSKGYIHGDIQPSNFVHGSGKTKHKIYLVDFQFSSPYIKNQKHISQEVVDNFSGTMRFCSIQTNNHKNTSRRDDLQSLIYSLIYLLKGYLPWFQLKSNTMIEAYNETLKIKTDKVNELLEGLPETFRAVLKYVKQLKFQQKPNYQRIRNQLLSLMKKNGYEMDYKYDWTYF